MTDEAVKPTRTSRMLAGTLRHLRVRPPIERPLKQLAAQLRIHKNTLSNLEKAEDGTKLAYEDLYRYELRYGIPFCIIACVAQIAGEAQEEIESKESGRLEALGAYMQVLVDRIQLKGTQEQCDPLTSLSDAGDASLIDELVTSVKAHIAGREEKRALFRNIDNKQTILLTKD